MAKQTGRVTVLLYTEAQEKIQWTKIPLVKDPDRFWLNMKPDYATDPEQMGDVKESLEGILRDINAGTPFTKKYDWEFENPNEGLTGQYLVLKDVNKSIVAQLQTDLTKAATDLCSEFGFTITSNELNILGFYQKINIVKAAGA